jgi:hypothetical protein
LIKIGRCSSRVEFSNGRPVSGLSEGATAVGMLVAVGALGVDVLKLEVAVVAVADGAVGTSRVELAPCRPQAANKLKSSMILTVRNTRMARILQFPEGSEFYHTHWSFPGIGITCRLQRMIPTGIIPAPA